MPKHNQMEVKMQLIKVKVVEESKGILEYFDDDKLIFDVYKSDGITDDITGKYTFNIKSEEMIKL